MTDEATGGAGGDGGASAADLLTGGAAVADAGGAGAGGDAGAGGAGDGAGDQGGGGGDQGGAADQAFLSQFPTDALEGDSASLQDWVKASGVKDLAGLAKVARDNQRALRESGRVKVPGEGAAADEVAAFRTAIGVPESAEGYQVAAIKGADGNDVPLDTPLLQRLAATAHEAGVPKAGYEALVNDFVAAQLEEFNGMEAEQRAAGKAWADKQGDKSPARLAAVNRGAQVLGISGEEVAALRNSLGATRALEMLSGLGDKVGEDVLLGPSGGQAFLVSGDQAQAEIDRMRGDPALVAKMTVQGTPENAKYNRLLATAGEAANRRQAAGL